MAEEALDTGRAEVEIQKTATLKSACLRHAQETPTTTPTAQTMISIVDLEAAIEEAALLPEIVR